MTPDDIRERFGLYRKWFRTLLAREFMNLPSKSQEKFLDIASRFLEDCRRVFEEQKTVKERVIEITVTGIQSPDNREENYIVCGTANGVDEEIRLGFVVDRPKPRVGSKIRHTIYSMDGGVWYSSKDEMIAGKGKEP